jgi:hypothetical protein
MRDAFFYIKRKKKAVNFIKKERLFYNALCRMEEKEEEVLASIFN